MTLWTNHYFKFGYLTLFFSVVKNELAKFPLAFLLKYISWISAESSPRLNEQSDIECKSKSIIRMEIICYLLIGLSSSLIQKFKFQQRAVVFNYVANFCFFILDNFVSKLVQGEFSIVISAIRVNLNWRRQRLHYFNRRMVRLLGPMWEGPRYKSLFNTFANKSRNFSKV